ncbi:Heterokaryon incompatibility protein (HET) domain containing protein [Rhypophila sp. PSN 637]
MSLAEVRATLPPCWRVEQAMDSRYLFIFFKTNSSCSTSWLHPDPNFDLSLYFPPLVPKHCPKYEALSYAWGIDTTVSPIIVDSRPGQPGTSLWIRPNLLVALQHLRTSRTARTLWIDAICINQDDGIEKATQITKMGSIYSLAYRVVIWLGPEKDDSDIALSVLKEVGFQVESPSQSSIYPSPVATRPNLWRSDTPLSLDQNVRDAIKSLVLRPWFYRLCVIQEVQLASTISILQCGPHDISLPVFVNSLQFLAQNSMTYVPASTMASCRRLPSKSPSYLLRHVAMLNCSEPRDKIYGLLALLPQSL